MPVIETIERGTKDPAGPGQELPGLICLQRTFMTKNTLGVEDTVCTSS